MVDAVAALLERDQRFDYALAFGSSARGTAHAGSDLDIALGMRPGIHLDPSGIGALIAQLESVAGLEVDLVLLDEAPPGLAYRIFRDGTVLFVRDRRALVDRKARAILEYLDFQPIEELCTRGVLAAAARGR